MLGESLRRAGAMGVLVARQRLELASLDVQDEATAFGGLLARVLAVAFLLLLAMGFAGAAVVIAFWHTAPVLAAGGVALAFAIAALFAWRGLLRAWAAKPPFLQATLEELRRDVEELSP